MTVSEGPPCVIRLVTVSDSVVRKGFGTYLVNVRYIS